MNIRPYLKPIHSFTSIKRRWLIAHEIAAKIASVNHWSGNTRDIATILIKTSCVWPNAKLSIFSDEGQGTTCVEIDDDDDCTFSYVLIEGSEKVQIYVEEEKSKNCFVWIQICVSFLIYNLLQKCMNACCGKTSDVQETLSTVNLFDSYLAIFSLIYLNGWQYDWYS